MVLEKIPTFTQVKNWAKNNNILHSEISGVNTDDHHTRYLDSEASNAAPVQSVNGSVGDVAVPSPSLKYVSESQNIPANTGGEVFWKTLQYDSSVPTYFRVGGGGGQNSEAYVRARVTFDNGNFKDYNIFINVGNNTGGSNYFTTDDLRGFYGNLNGDFVIDDITADGFLIDKVDLYYEGIEAGDGITARFDSFTI